MGVLVLVSASETSNTNNGKLRDELSWSDRDLVRVSHSRTFPSPPKILMFPLDILPHPSFHLLRPAIRLSVSDASGPNRPPALFPVPVLFVCVLATERIASSFSTVVRFVVRADPIRNILPPSVSHRFGACQDPRT